MNCTRVISLWIEELAPDPTHTLVTNSAETRNHALLENLQKVLDHVIFSHY